MAIAWLKRGMLLLATALLIVAMASFQVQSEDPPDVSFDGLHLEPSREVAAFYVKPDADFSVYKRFIMLDAYVAFKKNWQRNTVVAGRRVSNKEMETIKTEVSSLFHATFKEQMEADDGYPMVADSGDDVLIVRPAIIDLDITAPDIPVPGRSRSYVASAGAATLYLELYDSVSGEILARIVDRRRMGNYGHMQWSNSVTNRAEAQRLFARWATMLRQGLDEIHEEKFQADQALR